MTPNNEYAPTEYKAWCEWAAAKGFEVTNINYVGDRALVTYGNAVEGYGIAIVTKNGVVSPAYIF